MLKVVLRPGVAAPAVSMKRVDARSSSSCYDSEVNQPTLEKIPGPFPE
jgi:hypothetical protein